MRECGQCSWCCYFTTAPELHKDTYEWCAHCNNGCRIYGATEYPESCGNFTCLWHNQPQVPEALRPDRCGVMFERVQGGSVFVGHVDPERPEAWKAPEIGVFVEKIKQSGNSVIMYTSKGKKYL